ncbi:hypothetical protein SAMN05421759_1185 [Roseivivax lentus]|uniref:Polysaccharide lyase n=1 Tax=Roseivivax lentus TaxID=633194 RepID=A0A1N7PNP9_9RHOB|nr:hypothetical protein [Roseivivax lentus]SIT12245.1 hypothetical protein SAMN05421759_1185 [Roseivivax lentus]
MVRDVFLKSALVLSLVAALCQPAAAQSSNPGQISGWKVSCGADRGALTKQGKTYIFRPSSNHCDGHTPWGWDQRTEIFSRKYSRNLQGRYLFETTVSLTSPSSQKFDVFQMHDARKACAPPLKVEWGSDNRVALRSHYKVAGKGEDHCIQNELVTANYQRKQVLKRDGTKHLLQILLDLDGHGSFSVSVLVDGRPAIQGQYSPDLPAGVYKSVSGIRMNTPKIDRSQKINFKHGVYAKNRFPFELRSEGMRMVRLKQ